MNRIDEQCSAADWLIEYPYLLPLFEELGIDYCCGGRSLQSACEKANVDLQTFLQRMAALEVNDNTIETVRPLSYWYEHHPPGYLLRDAAASVQPVELAEEICTLGLAFADWIGRPVEQRWDSFALQIFSAHLFSRFRTSDEQARIVEVGLLELKWPPGSASIRACLQSLQDLLAPPFAVFRAVRAPLAPQGFPTPQELRLAEVALLAAPADVRQRLGALRAALDSRAARSSRRASRR